MCVCYFEENWEEPVRILKSYSYKATAISVLNVPSVFATKFSASFHVINSIHRMTKLQTEHKQHREWC